MESFAAELLERLRTAQRVAALTGAGTSAESGVPTFRDALTGLWARFRAEELATPEAFSQNPKLVWDWYAMRRRLVRRAEPNEGHLALARLEDLAPVFTLITQNVDGLHQRAGSRAIVELHGNLGRTRCQPGGDGIGRVGGERERPAAVSGVWCVSSARCGLVRGVASGGRSAGGAARGG